METYGLYLFLVAFLWTLWFVVLCGERGWFRGTGAAWRAMSPPTRGVMAVLCVCCTVSAQKPAASGNGGANPSAVAAAVSPAEGGAALLSSAADGALLATTANASLTGTVGGSSAPAASAEPLRIVLQSAPASDASAVPAFAGESGWTAPAAASVAPGLDALSFDGAGPGVPCPVRFAGATNVAVRTVVLAARGSATNLATLVDGPETARLRIAPDGSVDPDAGAIERAPTENQRPGPGAGAGQSFGVNTPRPPGVFGGSAGRPDWRRNWRGEIAEVIGFNAPPDPDVRAGVANYLAIRWGFGGHPATTEQRQAAVAAGLRYGRTWGTALIFR